jgi:hypothetical protein
VDMQHASVVRWWLDTAVALSTQRQPVTKSQALERLLEQGLVWENAA